MIREKWDLIVGNIKDNFDVEDSGSEHLEDEGGVDIEYIVFAGPLGKMRLEYVEKPIIVDKKTTYSKRIGSGTTVDYIYDQKEKSAMMSAYKWDEVTGEWMEINAANFIS